MDLKPEDIGTSSALETPEEIQKQRAKTIVDQIIKDPNAELIDDIILIAQFEKNKPVPENFMASPTRPAAAMAHVGVIEKYNQEYCELLDKVIAQHRMRNRLALYGEIGRRKLGEAGVLEELIPRWTEEKIKRANMNPTNSVPQPAGTVIESAAK